MGVSNRDSYQNNPEQFEKPIDMPLVIPGHPSPMLLDIESHLHMGVAIAEAHNETLLPLISSARNPSEGILDLNSLQAGIQLSNQRSAAAMCTTKKFGDLTSDELLAFVSSKTREDSAPSITEYLLERHRPQGPITGLRATMIQPCTDRYDPWPLLTWTEGDDIDIMAIFKIDSQVAPCSCLMHYGIERCWDKDGKRWSRSFVFWAVAAMEHMAELFIAARHISRDLEPIKPQATNLHGENGSRAEYISHEFGSDVV